MKKLLILLLATLIVTILIAINEQYHCAVNINFMDYVIEISLLGIILLSVFILIVLYQGIKLILLLKYYPAQIKQRLKRQKITKEITNILNIYSAMYLQNSSKAKNYLGNTQLKPLEDIFLLPIAYEEKDYFLAEKLSLNLLNQPNLKYLAYEFLAKIKFAQQDYPMALKYGIFASEINLTPKIIELLSEIYMHLNLAANAYDIYRKMPILRANGNTNLFLNGEGAQRTKKYASTRIHDKNKDSLFICHEYEALTVKEKLSHIALSAARTKNDQISWVKKSLAACKTNLEAWDFYLDLLQEKTKKLEKIIQEAWLNCPNYELIKKYLKISNEPTPNFILKMESLLNTNPLNEYEHYLILAKLALESNNEQKALMYLKKILLNKNA
jgi:hypothetical protein